MKAILLFPLLVSVQTLVAQTFTEVGAFPELAGVSESSIAFADVDGDNDQDLLVTGKSGPVAQISKLYINDGSGKFTEMPGTPFEGVKQSSIAFADIDGDNDQDLLITGSTDPVPIAKLYINDGAGHFTEMAGTSFEKVRESAIAFADVDGDNDRDVLVTGYNGSEPVTALYLNDGTGHFTEIPGTSFESVRESAIAFADVDGDQDQDVLLTGYNGTVPIAKLYINDGLGHFTEMAGTSFESVRQSSVAFADVDGDNDPDVLITGFNGVARIAKLYVNDGAGHFTEMPGTPFDGVRSSSIAFADVDGDHDQDVLITGLNSGSARIAKLYTNNGAGHFTEVADSPFDGVRTSSIAFADIDGDEDEDVLITGLNSGSSNISKLYNNDGEGNFTEIRSPFDGVSSGSVAFADVDGDDDQDVLITGISTSGFPSAKLHSNDGAGKFTEAMGTPFVGVFLSSIAFADIDGDQDQDVLMVGYSNTITRVAKLYTNNGGGQFTEMPDTPFEGTGGSIAFADIDGDQDQDVLITGYTGTALIAKLYTNDGAGQFAEMPDTPFEGVENSSIAFADVDGDNDQDVLITGRNSSSVRISKLYTNNGAGQFTEMPGTPFEGVWNGSVAFADVDGDNDLDILIAGSIGVGVISKLYTNDGGGNFTELTGTPFEGVSDGAVAFADVDGDQDQDVLITGYGAEVPIAKLYLNGGTGNFTELTGTPFDGVYASSVAFADVDGDNDLDIFITGQKDFNVRVAKLYTNDGAVSATVELIPRFGLDMIAFPNPLRSTTLYLSYDSAENTEIRVRIYNLNGILVHEQSEWAVIGRQTVLINTAALQQGNYFIEMDNGKSRGVTKLVVQ